jgi:hypothetical protein
VLLWEVLAGRHPFSSFSPLETAKRVKAGAPRLGSLRPDLPRRLTEAVDAMLAPAPSRRPSAKEAAFRLRSAWNEGTVRPRATMSRTRIAERAGPALLAAAYAGASAWLLPFFPSSWPLLLAALAATISLAIPPAGLAFALAMPILPLGNLSLGLAAVYAVFAVGWFATFARHSRVGLLFLLAPALAPAQALVLVPALLRSARGPVRRALLAAAAVPAAAIVAGLTQGPLPFTGDKAPESLGVAGSAEPMEVLGALTSFLTDRPVIWIEAVVIVAAAITAPYVGRWRLWGICAWGAVFMTAALVTPLGAVSLFPTAVWIILATALLAEPLLGRRR